MFGGNTFVPFDPAAFPPAALTLDTAELQAAQQGANYDVTEVWPWLLPEMELAQQEVAREGLERSPESNDLRSAFTASKNRLGSPGSLREAYVELAGALPDSGASAWYAGWAGVNEAEWLRRGETPFKEARLGDATDERLLDAVAEHPILLERPILVRGTRAIVGRPPSIVYQLRIFARRHKALFGALTAIFVVLAVGLVVSTGMYLRAERERDRALAAEQDAEKRRSEAEAMTEFLSEALAAVDPNKFGLAIALGDGSTHCLGDSEDHLSIQGISKVFTLSIANVC